MRRLLGTAALVLVLAGCGSDDGTPGSGATGEESAPVASPRPPLADTRVTLVSATAGGAVLPARHATFLASDAALASYVRQFSPGFATTLTQTAEGLDVAPGEVLVAQVVSVGCDKPVDAGVQQGESGVAIVATPVPTPRRECLAAVTTVGLAVVPVSLEGGDR